MEQGEKFRSFVPIEVKICVSVLLAKLAWLRLTSAQLSSNLAPEINHPALRIHLSK